MTLTTKKSRRIMIDGIAYRYQISTTAIDNNGKSSLNLTVQSESCIGSVLQTKGLISRNFWLDCSDTDTERNMLSYPIILPRHVANIVKSAIGKGWLPFVKGKPFILKLENKLFL